LQRSPAILHFSVLASGSKGNAVYIENGPHRILIDAGLSLRALTERMALIGRDMADLSAVFLTHEHTDHMRGAGLLAKKWKLPFYATRGTFEQLRRHLPNSAERRVIESEDAVRVGDVCVESYPTPHDGAESVAFVVRHNGRRLGHATDLGCVDDMVRGKLKGCDALLVESNHDVEMLRTGPYSWPLKQRVGSDHGHLSNVACGELLSHVRHEALKTVVLMHLSETNNRPEIAHRHAAEALSGLPARLIVSEQDAPTPLIPVE